MNLLLALSRKMFLGAYYKWKDNLVLMSAIQFLDAYNAFWVYL